SHRWAELWARHSSAPWSAMAPDFKNFNGSYAEECALEVVRGIVHRYPSFSSALKKLADADRVKVTYVIGNHDFMLNLSHELRRAVVDFLSINHSAKKQFPIFYPDHGASDNGASVYAIHGNSYDASNWHNIAEGRWAFGDAIVLRLVNRFAVEACAALGIRETSPLGEQFHELDNVEPTTDIPIYVRWLLENR